MNTGTTAPKGLLLLGLLTPLLLTHPALAQTQTAQTISLPAQPLDQAVIDLARRTGLAIGGDLMVGAASAMARSLGVGDVVIASTIVAVGTSLPELATSVLAARRNEGELALGNIVGSNIFNLLLVLGTTSLVAPVALPAGGGVALVFMVGLAMVLLPFSLTDQRRITRTEGVVLVAIYAGFTAWQLLRPA